MDSNDKIIELLQEIRDNQKIQIDLHKKARSISTKFITAAFGFMLLSYLPYFVKF